MVRKIFAVPPSQLCSLPAALPEGKQAPKPPAAGPASTAAESHLEEFLVPWQGKGLEQGDQKRKYLDVTSVLRCVLSLFINCQYR